VEARLLEIAVTPVVEPITDADDELAGVVDPDNETAATDDNTDVQPVPD
jgi:hypothetical protein